MIKVKAKCQVFKYLTVDNIFKNALNVGNNLLIPNGDF